MIFHKKEIQKDSHEKKKVKNDFSFKEEIQNNSHKKNRTLQVITNKKSELDRWVEGSTH